MTRDEVINIIKSSFNVKEVINAPINNDYYNFSWIVFKLDDVRYKELAIHNDLSNMGWKPLFIYYEDIDNIFYNEKYNLGHIKKFQFDLEMKDILAEPASEGRIDDL